MMADLIAPGLQSGWRALRRPAMPATCGHDMEVPDSELKRTRRLSKARPVGPAKPVNAARMLTPGAVMSGCHTHTHTQPVRTKMLGIVDVCIDGDRT